MKIKKYLKKYIIFNDKVYNQLLRRFDISNFKKHNETYQNFIECPLCKKYSCIDCSLNVFSTYDRGCNQLMDKILNGSWILDVSKDYVKYEIEDKDKAEKDLKKLRKFLESFQKCSYEYAKKIFKNEE